MERMPLPETSLGSKDKDELMIRQLGVVGLVQQVLQVVSSFEEFTEDQWKSYFRFEERHRSHRRGMERLKLMRRKGNEYLKTGRTRRNTSKLLSDDSVSQT